MTDDADHGTRPETPETPAVSFADVAGEPAEESVEHEQDALAETEEAADEQVDDHDGPLVDAAAEDNEAPQQPTLSSLLGGGLVSPGDDPVI